MAYCFFCWLVAMGIVEYLFLGITIFVALVLADLTSSAIKWHVANYKLRKELNKKKKKLEAFRDKLKAKLYLSSNKTE